MADLELPTTKSTPAKSVQELILLIYGEKKIGKTSLVSGFEDTLFIMCEPGGKGLEIFQMAPDNWKEFIKIIKLLEKGEHNFKTVAIDTIDRLYEMCFKHVCEDLVIEHPSESAYGAGWKAISTEFNTVMDRLVRLGLGVVFISHAVDKEFNRRTGGTYNKLVPSFPKQVAAYISAVADLIGYYGYYNDDRYLTIRGNEEVECGQRLGKNFRAVNGERIHSIPMGNDESEAFENFMAAFRNEQEDVCDPEGVAVLSDVAAKRKK